MLTVADLQTLARLDPMLPVSIGVVYQDGSTLDLMQAEGETIDVFLTDDGAPCGVLLIGRRHSTLPTPVWLTVQCSCGAEVIVKTGDEMPEAHDACLRIEP
jgi:hypothetical protein